MPIRVGHSLPAYTINSWFIPEVVNMKPRVGKALLVLVILIIALLLLTTSQRPREPVNVAAHPIGPPVVILAPLGLPPVPVPPDNPPTTETIALGRQLYYDPVLSADHSISCATCHHPDKGFADARQFSEGVQGKLGSRNSPTVLNSAYYEAQFWDGRAASLEKQAEGPVQNPVEMAHTLTGVEQRLNANRAYRELFKKAFGPGRITYDMVEKAIATFERSVISGNSLFDRWYFGKDKTALSAAAQRGFEVFRDPKKGNCAVCHSVDEKSALFTDNKFHNIGVGATADSIKDLGRYEVTKQDRDRGAFKTPSLRNIAQTAPYFHDGSRRTLKEVIDFYIGGGNSNAYLDPQIHALDFLSGQERADLLAFLESLTGEVPASTLAPEKIARR